MPPPNNAEKPKINKLSVNEKGQISLNDKVFTLVELKKTLVQMKAADPEVSVVVKGSADVDYQHMVSVLDALQQADITKVGLATDTQ